MEVQSNSHLLKKKGGGILIPQPKLTPEEMRKGRKKLCAKEINNKINKIETTEKNQHNLRLGFMKIPTKFTNPQLN